MHIIPKILIVFFPVAVSELRDVTYLFTSNVTSL